jgi:DNA repair protein RadC
MRYRLKLASWIVHREAGQPSPRILGSPEAVALLARDFLRAADDDKEHFWVIFLNAQNHYLMHTLVSTGTQSASLVHPREVPLSSSSTTTRPAIRPLPGRTSD